MQLSEPETQLLLAVAHLPGRYGRMMGFSADTPSRIDNLRRFGERWFADYLVPWEEALTRLQARGLLAMQDGLVQPTAAAQALLRSVEEIRPLYWYEYNLFFARAQRSAAHSAFCAEVYGEDLGQHGLADVEQLAALLALLALSPGQRVLDIGCGCGRITAWLAARSGAHFTGVDLAEEGIAAARALPQIGGGLRFAVGNMNCLDLPDAAFDAVVSVDTLYYAADLAHTLAQLVRLVAPGGQLGLFFSQWIGADAEVERLRADGTDLGRALTARGLAFAAVDLTAAELRHWSDKLRALQVRRPDFLAEGSEALYLYRLSEAERYAGWRPCWRSRYLYRVYV